MHESKYTYGQETWERHRKLSELRAAAETLNPTELAQLLLETLGSRDSRYVVCSVASEQADAARELGLTDACEDYRAIHQYGVFEGQLNDNPDFHPVLLPDQSRFYKLTEQ